MFTEQQGPPAPALLPTSGSQLVNREETQQRGAAKDFTNQQGENLARLRSFGETFGDIGRLQARDAGLLGQINSFRQNSQNVLPLELDAAQQREPARERSPTSSILAVSWRSTRRSASRISSCRTRRRSRRPEKSGCSTSPIEHRSRNHAVPA